MQLKSRTALIELTFEQRGHRHWMLSAFCIVSDDLTRRGENSELLRGGRVVFALP